MNYSADAMNTVTGVKLVDAHDVYPPFNFFTH